MDKENIIEALNDFLDLNYTSITPEDVVINDIEENRNDLIHLDMNNPDESVLKERVETKVRDLQEKIKSGFFKRYHYPRELYEKDFETKRNYLNENHSNDCPKCKKGVMKLVPSGMQWRCTNRCGITIWTTTEEREFLKVSPNN